MLGNGLSLWPRGAGVDIETPPAPGDAGQPMGLLLALTYAGDGGGSPPPSSTVGEPIGLLLTLTKDA